MAIHYLSGAGLLQVDQRRGGVAQRVTDTLDDRGQVLGHERLGGERDPADGHDEGARRAAIDSEGASPTKRSTNALTSMNGVS